MLIRRAADGTLGNIHAEPLYVSFLEELSRATHDYTMIPFTDTMLTNSIVARSYTETLPCQWSLLIIDGRKKQISLINGRTIARRQQTEHEVAQVVDRNVRDAAYWLCKAMGEAVDELSSYKKLILFVPDENEHNSFNDKEEKQNSRHDLDAASGPFICAMLECLLVSDRDEDYTQHFLRHGLHRYLSTSFGRTIWAITLAFNSKNTRLGIADRIKQQFAGTYSPIRLSVELLRILGNHASVDSPDNVEDIYSGWLKQGDNKDSLDAEDDGCSDDEDSWRSESEDENNAGGPPSISGSDRTSSGTSDHTDNEGDDGEDGEDGEDGDDEHGPEEEDGDDEDGNQEDGNEDDGSGDEYRSEGGGSSPSSDDSDPDGGQGESSESGSEYGTESDSNSSDDGKSSTGQRGRRETAPSPSPPLRRPSRRSSPEESSSEGPEEEPFKISPQRSSRGSRCATSSRRGRQSESQESHMTPPERSVYGSDCEEIEVLVNHLQGQTPSGGEHGERDVLSTPRYALRTHEKVEYYSGYLGEPEEEDHPTVPDKSSDSGSESAGSWATVPEEIIEDLDQKSNRPTHADPHLVEENAEIDPENGEDVDPINKYVPTDEADEHSDDGYGELPGDTEDLTARYQELVEPEEEHWFTQRGNQIRNKYGLYDMRDFGEDGLDAEGRLKQSGGLIRGMNWIEDLDGPRRKRLRVR